jgi:hypothetical protein
MALYESKKFSWTYVILSIASALVALYPIAVSAIKLENLEPRGIAQPVIFGLASLWAAYSAFFKFSLTEEAALIHQGFSTTRLPYSVIEEALCIPTPPIHKHQNAAVQVTVPRQPLPVVIRAAHEHAYPWLGSPQSVLLICRGSKNNYVLPHPDAENIVRLISSKLAKT